MRSRLPVLVALALALCALPSLHAFAAAQCTPCCEMAGSEDPGCGLAASDCCELAPAAPVGPVEHATSQPASPALASAQIALIPAPALLPAPHRAGAFVSPAPPARLSVVRRL